MSQSSDCEEEELLPRIIPAVFTGHGEYGDFEMMIRDKQYDDALFLFNDNVLEHKTVHCGGGNAAIRPYNPYGGYTDGPRSAGIPTGFSRRCGGYRSLTASAVEHIDEAFDEIRELIGKFEYRRIFFSADPPICNQRPQLGTSIFVVAEDVKRYITNRIYQLGEYCPIDA